MAGKKTSSTSNRKRSLHPLEVKFIQQMAKLLSDESGFTKEWIEEVLLKTLPERQIAKGALDGDGSIDALADQLGMTERHL